MYIHTINSVYELKAIGAGLELTKVRVINQSEYVRLGESKGGNGMFLTVGEGCHLYEQEEKRCIMTTSPVQKITETLEGV